MPDRCLAVPVILKCKEGETVKRFKVTGMSCAACSARVEKAVKAVNGAENVSVNLLTGELSVDGNAKEEDIISAVIAAGYGIADNTEKDDTKADASKAIARRLTVSVILLLILMYFSMFRMLFDVPVPEFLSEDTAALGIFELVLTLAVCIVNRNFFINGIRGVIHKAPNMDTLVSLGAASSFFYSLFIVIKRLCGTQTANDHLYFESAAMILTLITVGKLLEAKAKGKTADAIASLKDMAPKTATVFRDGKEITVPADKLLLGDIFIVRPGESIPADGVITEGNASVDQSAVTGESIPVFKSPGDSVISATVNRNGFLKCRATAVGYESTFSKIIKTVSDATATKAPIARFADSVAGIFVPLVILAAAVTLLVWLLIGKSIGFSVMRATAVLVISCPCALGLATPVAIMAASGVGAKNGILYKTAVSLESCGKTDTVILDKTGTLTEGKPSVTDILSDNEEELLSLALSLEKQSSHPLALAVCDYAKGKASPLPVKDFKEIPGIGVEGVVDGVACFCGSFSAAEKRVKFTPSQTDFADKIRKSGKTPVVFLKDNKLSGIIAVADTLKKDSRDAVAKLASMGINVVMLTGDNEVTAKAIAEDAGIKTVIAGVLPDEKADAVKKYKMFGNTAMVGDGINDAPALSVADVGIAIGGGKDIASEAADVVLMNDSLSGVVNALLLGRKALLNIKENLFWAFIYNCLGIPLAAGVFSSLLGWELNPMFGAAAMSLSSVCVVTNALRLNLFKPYRKKEENIMEKTLKITGMMCPHCEAHMKSALEALDGIINAEASHEKAEAKITLSKDIDGDVLKKTVEDAGYTLNEII